MTWFVLLIVAIGLEQLAELVVSKRNAAWSFERSGVETGQRHFVLMVMLHTGLLVGAQESCMSLHTLGVMKL